MSVTGLSKRAALLLLGLLLALRPAVGMAEALTIYSATDTAAMNAVIAGFEARNPGIAVAYREYNTRELYEDVLAGRAAEADLVISSSMDLQAALVNEGLALTFDPDTPSPDLDWATWRNELFGFTYEPVAVLYNKAAFAGRPLPATRSQIAAMIRDDPEFFRQRVGSYDIARSGVGYLFATQDILRGYEIWRLVETFGRADIQLYCCTTDIFNDVAAGRLVFAYNVIGSYALADTRADPRVGIYLLEDYALVMSRSAFVPRTAPNPEAGKAFIRFLLSDEGQSLIDRDSSLISLRAAREPVRSDVLSGFGSLDGLLPIRIGPGLLAYLDDQKRQQFLKDWSAVVNATPEPAGAE